MPRHEPGSEGYNAARSPKSEYLARSVVANLRQSEE